MSYNDVLKSTVNLKQDFYVRIKISNTIGYITINDNIVPLKRKKVNIFS